MVAGLVAAQSFHSVLTGDASLTTRPMRRVVEPLRALGAHIDGRDDGTRAPLAIRGGPLRGVRCELGVASGQVKTALVLAGLQADGTTEVVEPLPSRDHTERMLGALGAPIERVDDRTLRVRRGSFDAFTLEVPGDPSSAVFFAVAASITPGSSIVLEGISLNPARLGFVDVLRQMGADLEVHRAGEQLGEPVGDLVIRAAPLTATTFAPDEAWIDEVPALAVAAAFADGVSEIRDAAELRVKESDRIGTLEQELGQLGVAVETRADGLTIRGGRPRAALLKSHGDHRIAMAAAVAATACEGDSTIRGWRAVASSYPGFAADLARLTDGTDS
jgi:3-phosphoshikimate 1-carboxyvinyltransferase